MRHCQNLLPALVGLSVFVSAGCTNASAILIESDPDGLAEAYSSVVAVSSGRAGAHRFCSGLITATQTVVVVSDCLFSADEAFIMVGDDARVAARIPVTAVEAIPNHPRFAAVRVAEPLLALDARLRPARGRAARPDDSGMQVTVVGYGLGVIGASILGVKQVGQFTADADTLRSELGGLCDGDVGAAVFDANHDVMGLVTAVPASCAPGAAAQWAPFDPWASTPTGQNALDSTST